MNAVVSGPLGKAILIRGQQMTVITVNDPYAELACHPQTVSDFLQESALPLFIEEVSEEQVRDELRNETDRQDALNLVLSVFDAGISPERRIAAANIAAKLISHPTVLDYVRNVMYSKPLPPDVNINLVRGEMDQTKPRRIHDFVQTLLDDQVFIKLMYEAWCNTPIAFGADDQLRQKIWSVFIREGVPYFLVTAIRKKGDLDSVLQHVGFNAVLHRAPAYALILRGFIMSLLKPKTRSISRRTGVETISALMHLWREFKEKGNIQARDGIVEHYRYLVTKTRQRYMRMAPIEFAAEDLDQEGQTALVKAVDHFDPRRKIRFESYAITMIRGAMLEYLRRKDWVPRAVSSASVAIESIDRNKTGKLEDGEFVLPLDAFYQLYYEANVLQVVSLEDRVGDDELGDLDPLIVLESVKSRSPDPHVMAIVESQRRSMAQCITWLPVQERAVVVKYYCEGMTLKQIAKEIGRSESRAHQLHSQAIQRLSGFIARQRGLFFPEALPVTKGEEINSRAVKWGS